VSNPDFPTSPASSTETSSAETSSASNALTSDLEQISALIQTAAHQREGNCFALLELLRQLNDLHYDIRETLFRDALPDNRQKLYSFLKDIEQEGGWPYIPRMKLLALLENMELSQPQPEAVDNSETEQP